MRPGRPIFLTCTTAGREWKLRRGTPTSSGQLQRTATCGSLTLVAGMHCSTARQLCYADVGCLPYLEAVLLLLCRTASQDEESSPNVLLSLPRRSAADEPEGKCIAINKVLGAPQYEEWFIWASWGDAGGCMTSAAGAAR